jgi:hypothetical protein
MRSSKPSLAGLTLRPLDGLLCAGGSAQWVSSVAEAEILLRLLAAEPRPEPVRVEVGAVWADGRRGAVELALAAADAHRERALLQDVLDGWMRAAAEADDPRAPLLAWMEEIARHVAHNRAVGERVGALETAEELLDAAGVERRARALAVPPPAPLRGARFVPGRPLAAVARDVRSDVSRAVVAGLLPAGVSVVVSEARFELERGLEIEVVRAPRLWLPDVCEQCLSIAYGLERRPPSGPRCGHTPALAGMSVAAQGVLLTVLALGDAYNADELDQGPDSFFAASAFPLATFFGPQVGSGQRDKLRSSEAALRAIVQRRRAAGQPVPHHPAAE